MLDRSGDAQSHVQLRGHRLAGLTDLELARVVAGIDGGTRGTDRSAHRVGKLLDDDELVGAADTAATGDHDGGLGELRPVTGDSGLTRGDLGGVGSRGRHLHADLLAGTGARCGLDRAGPHGDDRNLGVDLRLDGERATEDRVDRGAVALDLDDVGEHTGPDAGRPSPGDFLTLGGRRDQHRRRGRRLDELLQHIDERRDEVALRDVGLGDINLGRTGGLEIVDQRCRGAGRADHDGGRLTQCAGGRDQFGGDLLDCTLGVLNEHKYFSHTGSLFSEYLEVS